MASADEQSVLTADGLNVQAFDPALAAMLGTDAGQEGANVLASTIGHSRRRVEVCDWLYVLAKNPGTCVRRSLIVPLGQRPDVFENIIEEGLSFEPTDSKTPRPRQLTSAVVSPQVLTMLAKAKELAVESKRKVITDDVLTLALFETADEDLTDLLKAWIREDKYAIVLGRLRSGLIGTEPPELFLSEGKINPKAFEPSGMKLCRQLEEDAASLSVKQITTRHLLYTLLENHQNALCLALALRGTDIKKDLHAALSRELAHPGRKRKGDFRLARESMFRSTIEVFVQAQRCAMERGSRTVTEHDVCRAFAQKQSSELSRLFPENNPLDIAAVRNYIDSVQPDEEEEQSGQRFTVKQIEENIRKAIFGQDEAIRRVIPWIKRLRFGLPRDGRPAGVFLFLGPTGTGKTQLAKELARYVFGDEDMMIFLEMGQFQSKESMNMFIGAAPGYVGYGDGKLTNGLRDKPQCVVLFDEIEKANVEVFDTLLRFADEGMISDPAGPVRDGRNCIIVMTTNAGQNWLREHLKNNPEERNNPTALTQPLFEAAMEELKSKGFRPEFLGRVDERITYVPFDLKTCRSIVDSVLKKELAKFADLKGVTIEVPESVRVFLAEKAYKRSEDEGARGAPRAVNEFIVTPAIDQLADREEAGTMPTKLVAGVLGEVVSLYPPDDAPPGSGESPATFDVSKTEQQINL